jgi:hypothetical protein
MPYLTARHKHNNGPGRTRAIPRDIAARVTVFSTRNYIIFKFELTPIKAAAVASAHLEQATRLAMSMRSQEVHHEYDGGERTGAKRKYGHA